MRPHDWGPPVADRWNPGGFNWTCQRCGLGLGGRTRPELGRNPRVETALRSRGVLTDCDEQLALAAARRVLES